MTGEKYGNSFLSKSEPLWTELTWEMADFYIFGLNVHTAMSGFGFALLDEIWCRHKNAFRKCPEHVQTALGRHALTGSP